MRILEWIRLARARAELRRQGMCPVHLVSLSGEGPKVDDPAYMGLVSDGGTTKCWYCIDEAREKAIQIIKKGGKP
jgi:hypothetical protein